MKSFDETWEKIHENAEWGQYPTEPVIRFVARNYYHVERDKIRILDFGCGGGAHTWYLAREGFDTYAFDGSKAAVKKVQTRLEKENLYADLRVLDGCELDYEDNFFDAVIDNVCIYGACLDHIKRMYSNIYRILKQNGKLFSSMFSTETTGFGTGERLEHNTYANPTIGRLAGRGTSHFYEDGEIEKILSEIGFKDIVVEWTKWKDQGDLVSTFIVHAAK